MLWMWSPPPSCSTVKEWVKLRKVGRESLGDDTCPGHLSEAVTFETIQLVEVELLCAGWSCQKHLFWESLKNIC